MAGSYPALEPCPSAPATKKTYAAEGLASGRGVRLVAAARLIAAGRRRGTGANPQILKLHQMNARMTTCRIGNALAAHVHYSSMSIAYSSLCPAMDVSRPRYN
ncbi:hypothetical protein IG631_01679 [Alternaria alternata]|nr:hypothetical protein IG631_01679 [Alternaria alternata]